MQKGAYQYAKGPTGTQSSVLSPEQEETEDTPDWFREDSGDELAGVTPALRLENDVRGITNLPTSHDIGNQAGSTPASLQQAVDIEARAWAKLWKVPEVYDFEEPQPSWDSYPGAITASMIRKACLSFDVKTGLGGTRFNREPYCASLTKGLRRWRRS